MILRNLTGTHVGRVAQYPGLSNIMFDNRFTIKPIYIDSSGPRLADYTIASHHVTLPSDCTPLLGEILKF